MANHRADVWGVGAFLLGLLTAFAVWLDSAGFIGDVLDDGLAIGVGLTRVIVPVALIGIGVLLVMGGGIWQFVYKSKIPELEKVKARETSELKPQFETKQRKAANAHRQDRTPDARRLFLLRLGGWRGRRLGGRR